MKSLKELQELVAKLNSLLQNPQPGLMTWNSMVTALIKEINTFI